MGWCLNAIGRSFSQLGRDNDNAGDWLIAKYDPAIHNDLSNDLYDTGGPWLRPFLVETKPFFKSEVSRDHKGQMFVHVSHT